MSLRAELRPISPRNRAARKLMCANARNMIAHEGQIGYSNHRPMPMKRVNKPGSHPPFDYPFATDCSGSFTMLAKSSGCPDPNNMNYSGYGNTGTLLAHCDHIKRWQARAGDGIIFDTDDGYGVHVAMLLQRPWFFRRKTKIQVLSHPRDAKTFSHGSEGGPSLESLANEISYFSGPYTFIRTISRTW